MTEPKKDKQSDDQIKGITSDGEAPKRRIATVAAALTGYQSMVNADIVGGRGVRFGNIAGIYAGFPPIPPSEMDRQGMGDMPNVNTREFEAAILDYTDITLGVHCGNLQWFEVEAENEDETTKQAWSEYLTKCFNDAIGIWDDPCDDGFFSQSGRYILESSIRDTQMALFNIGVCMFRGPIDFRFTTVPTRKVFVPEGTKITLDNCSAIYIQDDMSASQLWQMVQNKVPGWDKEQVTKLLYYNSGSAYDMNAERWTFAQFVEWTQANSSYILTDFLPVTFVHQYVQEFNGKISHSIFSPTVSEKGGKKGKLKDKQEKDMGEAGWLYDAPKSAWACTWPQVVSLFSDSVGGEGRYHSAKGFGDRNYDLCNHSNLMFNRTSQAAIVNNTPMFTAGNEGDRQKLNEVVFAPWCILTPELQVTQLNLRMDVGSMAQTYDMGNRVRNENNRKFPLGAKSKTGEALTATQVNTDTAKEAQFTNLQILQYRATGLDKLGAEMYRRIAQPGSKYPEKAPGGKVAKYFRDRCKAFGIPEDALLKVRGVRANRNSGSGSMPIDLMKGKELLAVATPGEGQRNAQHKIAVALVGSEAADAYVQPLPEQPTDLTRQIDWENLFIQDGKGPIVEPNDAHEVHVPAHIQLMQGLQQVIMQFQEGGITPDNIDDAVLVKGKLDAGIEHTGKHLQFMSEMKLGSSGKAIYEGILKEGVKILGALAKMSQEFEQEIAEAAQATQQAQGQQQSPEMVKALADIEIMKVKAQADIAIKQAQAEAKLGNMAMQHSTRNEMKLAGHEMDLGLKATSAVAQQEQQRAASQEKIVSQAAKDTQSIHAQHAHDMVALAAEGTKAAITIETAKQKAKEPKPKKPAK